MRRGQRNKWTHDAAPQGEGIVVIHNDLGQRKEVHDLTELRASNLAAQFNVTPKSIRELMEAGIIK
jgi:hypothetical protein